MLELIPKRFGTVGQAQELLIRVVPPRPTVLPDRPGLNLSLVLDRSGSMQGEKFTSMMQGARRVIESLLPTDRLSVVVFNGRVSVPILSTLVTDKPRLLSALALLRAEGNTALHPGWKDGIHQIVSHLDPQRINRVLLLTDGQANEGEVSPQVITADVARLARQGVTTSTLGFGDGYNEDLLAAMARAGDGNHYFVESPGQLPGIFQVELGGLMATLGHRARLTLRSADGHDLLTPLERDETGALRLNDLIAGNPLAVMVRLWGADLRVELSYVDVASGQTVTLSNHLSLPKLSRREFESLPPSAQVTEEMGLLESAKALEEAAVHLQQDDPGQACVVLRRAIASLRGLPRSQRVTEQIQQLEEIVGDIEARRQAMASKKAYAGSHGHYKGQYK